MRAGATLVIGCGVSGLSCAVRLLEEGRPAEIWARELAPQTTSAVAAAFWYPYRAYPRERVTGWARTSLERFSRLAAEVPAAGVAVRPAMELFREPVPDPWWGGAVPRWRHARPDELPAGYVDGYRFDAPVIDTRRYLPWLMARVEELGGSIEQREVSSLEEALAHRGSVVNCSGLGSRELAGDGELVALRGEVVRVEDPGLEMVRVDHDSADGVAYVIPRGDDCVLGGSVEEGREDREPDERVARGILERCERLEPRIVGQARRGGAAGVRPGRATVRLAAEEPAPGRRLVHNYGHGGAGVTLSWGCAEEVAGLL